MPIIELQTRIGEIEQDLGINRDILAQAVGVDRRTVARWQAGKLPRGETRERLDELWSLREQLLSMLGTREAIREWMHSGSMYLGGLAPLDALKAGRIDRVRADLDGIAAGVYL